MITNYFKSLIADNLWHTAGDGATDIPATYYLALSTTCPMADGSGVTEPGASTYVRQTLGALSVAENGATSNAAVISWARFESALPDPITHWALFDAQGGGNLLMGGELDGPKHIDASTTIIFDVGNLTLNVLDTEE